MLFLLEKIIELLSTNGGLTVPEIQHELKSKFGISVLQKWIIHVIEKHGDKMDVILKCGKLTVMLTPEYRKLINRSKNSGNRD
jgi:hypothetical protein